MMTEPTSEKKNNLRSTRGEFALVAGRKFVQLDINWLAETITKYSQIEVDIGTGDGRFVLDRTREEAKTLFVGIDPVAETMAESARRASRSPKKGGRANAVFLRGSAELLPGPLAGVADLVTVNYPWGSLMRIVSEPDVEGLRRIRAVCKTDAILRIHLNQSVLANLDYLERLGHAAISAPANNPNLPVFYAEAGFKVKNRYIFAGDPPFRTRWGRQLARGAARKTLFIEAIAGGMT